MRDLGSIPGLGRFPWRRAWQPIPVFLPGKSPWTEEPGGLQSGGPESDMTERLSTACLVACVSEGSYLVPRDSRIESYRSEIRFSHSLWFRWQKNLPVVLETGSVPVSGRSPGEGNGYPLQYSCLENPMNRGAWWATVTGVAKGPTRLSDLITLFIKLNELSRNLFHLIQWCSNWKQAN